MFKEIVDARTDGRTDDGRRTLKDHKSSLGISCSGELIKYLGIEDTDIKIIEHFRVTYHSL